MTHIFLKNRKQSQSFDADQLDKIKPIIDTMKQQINLIENKDNISKSKNTNDEETSTVGTDEYLRTAYKNYTIS